MKKILLFITLINFSIIQSQIVNIPDTNFKNALILNGVDDNNDNQIQVSEAASFTFLDVSNEFISDLTGIEAFINLTELICRNNPLSSLDVSNNINLIRLDCGGNQLSILDVSNNTSLTHLFCINNQLNSLDVSNNTNLNTLYCTFNQLNSLDISNNTSLFRLRCDYNQLSTLNVSNTTSLGNLNCASNQLITLDVSLNTALYILWCGNNTNLSYINLKNGNNDNFNLILSDFRNLPNLETVCVDELNTNLTTYILDEVEHSLNFIEYCNFIPVQSNQINGSIRFDINNNDCDVSNATIPNLMLVTNNGTESFVTFTQNNGDYLLYTNDGDFITSITTNLPNYFTVNPSSKTNTFTGFNNTFTADFCVEPNQTVNDVNISLIPIIPARPGFNATYQIVYKNIGTTQLNGNITLEFD